MQRRGGCRHRHGATHSVRGTSRFDGVELDALQVPPPTLPGALAAVGGCELYALLHAYVYLPVSWVGRDDGHDDDDDEL